MFSFTFIPARFVPDSENPDVFFPKSSESGRILCGKAVSASAFIPAKVVPVPFSPVWFFREPGGRCRYAAGGFTSTPANSVPVSMFPKNFSVFSSDPYPPVPDAARHFHTSKFRAILPVFPSFAGQSAGFPAVFRILCESTPVRRHRQPDKKACRFRHAFCNLIDYQAQLMAYHT